MKRILDILKRPTSIQSSLRIIKRRPPTLPRLMLLVPIRFGKSINTRNLRPPLRHRRTPGRKPKDTITIPVTRTSKITHAIRLTIAVLRFGTRLSVGAEDIMPSVFEDATGNFWIDLGMPEPLAHLLVQLNGPAEDGVPRDGELRTAWRAHVSGDVAVAAFEEVGEFLPHEVLPGGGEEIVNGFGAWVESVVVTSRAPVAS